MWIQGLLSFTLGSEGDNGEWLSQPTGGSREPASVETLQAGRQFIHMDGRAVFKWAVRVVSDCVTDTIAHAGLAPDDIDLLVLHQANLTLNEAIRKSLKFAAEKTPYSLGLFGNTSSASIPLTMLSCMQESLSSQSLYLLLCGFGVGLSWGSVLLHAGPIVIPSLIEL